jgi:hypothetical protein
MDRGNRPRNGAPQGAEVVRHKKLTQKGFFVNTKLFRRHHGL